MAADDYGRYVERSKKLSKLTLLVVAFLWPYLVHSDFPVTTLCLVAFLAIIFQSPYTFKSICMTSGSVILAAEFGRIALIATGFLDSSIYYSTGNLEYRIIWDDPTITLLILGAQSVLVYAPAAMYFGMKRISLREALFLPFCCCTIFFLLRLTREPAWFDYLGNHLVDAANKGLVRELLISPIRAVLTITIVKVATNPLLQSRRLKLRLAIVLVLVVFYFLWESVDYYFDDLNLNKMESEQLLIDIDLNANRWQNKYGRISFRLVELITAFLFFISCRENYDRTKKWELEERPLSDDRSED